MIIRKTEYAVRAARIAERLRDLLESGKSTILDDWEIEQADLLVNELLGYSLILHRDLALRAPRAHKEVGQDWPAKAKDIHKLAKELDEIVELLEGMLAPDSISNVGTLDARELEIVQQLVEALAVRVFLL